MASEKISQLPSTGSSSGTDIYPLVQLGFNKSITFTNLQSSIASALTPSQLPIITLTGMITGSASGGSIATTISNNVITNVMMVSMPGNTVKGNLSGIAATPADLTVAQVQAMLSIPTSSSPLPFSSGGTGQTTQQLAINALVGPQTSGYYLRSNGTNVSMSAIQVADVPILNQSTTGTASNITATSNSTLTTLTALATASSLASIGTITSGVWNGTTIAVTSGGTGQSSALTQYGVVYASSTSAMATTAAGTAGYLLTSNNTSAPTFQQLNLGTSPAITGILTVTNGGIGQNTLTAHGVVIGEGNSGVGVTSAGTTGQVLVSNGASSDPAFSSTIAAAIIFSASGTALTVNNNALVSGTFQSVGSTQIANSAASQATLGSASSTAVHQVNGGMRYTTNTISSLTYAVDSTTTDCIIYTDSTSNTVAITLPLPTAGRMLYVYDLTGKASTNAITIKQHSAETINGLTQIVISNNYCGTILTSNGTNWIADNIPTSGSLFVTSGSSYTTPVNITPQTRFKFTLIGGGGGGGGINTANMTACGGGGGGGCVLFTTGLSANTAYTIAIGAAGTAGTATPGNGGNGGNTTLTIGATTYTAGGGSGGTDTATGAPGAGGTSTNGTLNITGKSGTNGGSITTAPSGMGGDSALGFGFGGMWPTGTGNSAGNPGVGFGGGGSGGRGNASSTGGAGTAGCILVEWQN